MEVLEDPTGKLTLADVRSHALASVFEAAPEPAPSWGTTSSAVWARFRLQAFPEQASVVAVLGWRPLDRVELYVPAGDGYRRLVSGRNVAAAERALPSRHPAFLLPPDLDTSRPLYLRAESRGPLALPLVVTDAARFLAAESAADRAWAALLGALLTLTGGLLLCGRLLRSAPGALLGLIVGSWTLVWAVSLGVAGQALWPERPEWTPPILSLALAALTATLTLFNAAVLSTRTRTPQLHWGLVGLTGLVCAQRIAAAWSPDWQTGLEIPALALLLIGLAASAVIRRRQGLAPARLMAASWFLLAAATAGVVAAERGALAFAAANAWALAAALLAFAAWTAAFVHDAVLRRRQQVARLRTRQRLETMGRLLAEVAHDLRNLLTVINGRVELALDPGDGPSGEALRRESLEEIQEAADRAKETASALTDFGRAGGGPVAEIELHRFLERNTRLLTSSIQASSTLAWDLTPARLPIQANSGRLLRVLVNLVVNAAEASSKGQTVTVRTRLEERCCPGGFVVEPYAVLSVIDAGAGIDPETQARIFEPFFTTKSDQGGAGLGLSAAHGIVRDAGGWIEVDSELGHGTTIRIYWPLAGLDAPRERALGERSPDGGRPAPQSGA